MLASLSVTIFTLFGAAFQVCIQFLSPYMSKHFRNSGRSFSRGQVPVPFYPFRVALEAQTGCKPDALSLQQQ